MRRAAILVCLLLVLPGCAASAKSTRKAKESAYDTSFAQVWNVVTDLVTADYPRLVLDDANAGRLMTDWHLIQQKAQPDLEGPGEQGQLTGGIFMRIGVRVEGVKGKPPWTVVIQAEAAEYKPGMAKVVPYARGAIDEPPFVQGRIDKLYARVYERLEKYAVPIRVTDAGGGSPALALDTTPWQELPAPLARVVAEVHAAAGRGDVDAVARHMSDPFASAIGPEAPRDRAIALWKADPTPLRALAGALRAGCVLAAGAATCPPGAASLKARFEERGGRWLLVGFAEE